MVMRSRLFFSLSLVALLVGSAPSSAQTSQPGATPAPIAASADFANEAIVLQRFHNRFSFEADGSGVREMTAVIHVQSEAGVKALAVLAFPYTSVDQSVEVDYVRVRKPDGTLVVTPPQNVQDMPADVTRIAPTYSDLHEKHVTVKGLGVGDTLEYCVRSVTARPQVPGRFWLDYTFVRDVISKNEELELSVPGDATLKISSPEVKPQIRDERGRRIYTWKTANLESRAADNQVKSGESARPSVQVTTFRTWDEVGRWYGDLQKPALTLTPALRAKAAELTAGLTGDQEKIQAIYAFVSTRVHYVSLSFGIGRFKSHPAHEVLGNEYGDCKDKHTLLAALLKAAGYDAWPALVNSSRPIDPDVPSPGQFDHVVTAVHQANALLWLDTTPEVAPFGLLLGTLRDKDALVIPDRDPARLVRTPADPPYPLFSKVTVTAKLSGDGTLTARFERLERSEMEPYLRAGFRSVPRTQWQDLVQQISYGAGFAGTVANVEASAPDDTTAPFRYSYDYTRKEYGDWSTRQIILPLPPLALPTFPADAEKPTEPIPLGSPVEVDLRTTLELPPEYTTEVPDAVDLKRDYAEYHASYSLKGHEIHGERHLIITKRQLTLSQLDDYRAFEKAARDDHGTWLRLESPTAVASGTPQGKPEAQPWFDKAITALRQQNAAAAEENLRRVLRIDPAYPHAHAALGGLYLVKNQPEDGLAELRKEIELHPEDTSTYRQLAFSLAWLRRPDEAIEVWRSLLKVDPKDLDAAGNLGELLVKAKRYPEALDLLERAVKQNPESASLQTSVGYAYLATEQSEKALSPLKKAVELDPSTARLNEVAYRMAEHSALLEQAREWAERAVANAEADSATAVASDLEAEDVERTGSLATYWDTLGWVYFRTGELDKAERYLRAAWVLSQSRTMGAHLGRLYERQGKRNEAARAYELAFAAGGRGPDAEDIMARYKRLTGKTLDASPPVALWPSPNREGSLPPGDELTRMRTFKLPAMTKESATAEFFIRVAPGPKTVAVRFISGSESLREAGKVLAAVPLRAEFPDQGPVSLARSAIVSCGPTGCDLTLLPTDAARPRD